MSKKEPPQQPTPNSKALMTIPEAAVKLNTTVFAVRRLCHSGELRYTRLGHPMLISPQAIKDCIRLTEAKAQLKRELKVAGDATRKEKLRALKASRVPAPHTYPCALKSCLECAKDKGRQAAIDLRKSLVTNG
jgi:excisionase family DNA binding protein